MSVHIHRLSGCRPAPLALYLKAIGILRIVSNQKDPTARGWWQNEKFCLMTVLCCEELEDFFLHEYSPTPFLSPWNKGSGFFKAEDKGLVPLEKSTAKRFASFREGILEARELLDEVSRADAVIRAIKDRTKTNSSFQSIEQRQLLSESAAYRMTLRELRAAIKKEKSQRKDATSLEAEIENLEFLISDVEKPPTKTQAEILKKEEGYKRILRIATKLFKSRKAALIPDCRRFWRGEHLDWMSASVVLDDNLQPKYPALLGTGGNDGNFDFTNNAMQRLGELFDLSSGTGAPTDQSPLWLNQALWDSPAALEANPAGQFLPGGGGGANSENGTAGAPLVNAWDFVLMMEGTIPFSAKVTRRLSNARTNTSAPFTVHSHSAGHATLGGEKDARGEQWMPIWSQPTTLIDFTSLLGDARMQLNRETVNRPIDAARAVSRLGVARGIESFVRYGFLERNGQATLAVPLGRMKVQANPRSHLIDDLASWMNRLQRLVREKRAPARLVRAERQMADAVFGALTHDYTAARWRLILETAADIEAIQAAGTAYTAGPIPKLKPAWVSAIYDQNDNDGISAREVRLALALASGTWKANGRHWPVRHHFLPLETGGRKFKESGRQLFNDPQVVATGRDAIADCGAIVLRRFIDAPDGAGGYFPLVSQRSCEATLADLAAVVDGHVDLNRVIKLARTLMALDWRAWNTDGYKHKPWIPSGQKYSNKDHPDEAWLAIRLGCLPWAFEQFDIKAEHSMVRRLLAGDGTTAANIALRRLRACGIRVPFEVAISDEQTAARWAAALAFPISKSTAQRAIYILNPTLVRGSND